MKKDFEELFLQELKKINSRFDGLENKVDGIETRFDGLENKIDGVENKVNGLEVRFDGIETRFDGLENKVDDLKDEFRDFSSNQELEHQATRKLINQAFEKINENILYQEKVDRIEKLLSKSKIRS